MNGLVLLDWDDTVVDDDSQITTDDLPLAIRAAIARGWQVGLNSDTPLKRLQGWWRLLGMNGPIIAEKGAVIWWPGATAQVISRTAETFASLRQTLTQLIAEQDGYALYLGDNTEFIRSEPRIASNDEVLVAVDAYRMCSLGAFVRRMRAGELLRDIETVAHVHRLLASAHAHHDGVSGIDFNRKHCWLGVNALDTSKSIGLHALLKQIGATPNIVMIGDSMADHLSVPGVHHLAVANAAPAFAELAEQVSNSPYAEGCVELLNTLP